MSAPNKISKNPSGRRIASKSCQKIIELGYRMKFSSIGMCAKIVASDPWEFVTDHGSFFTGAIVNFSDKSEAGPMEFIIELLDPINIQNDSIRNVYASPRHVGDTVDDLSSGSPVAFSFSNIPYVDRQFAKQKGTINFIGSIELIAETTK